MYSARAVANYFLKRGRREGVELDPLKLQKLIFFAHGWHLAIRKQPLVNERAEAWPYGPVFPSVYHEFKRHGRDGIRRLAIDWVDGEPWVPVVPETATEARAILNRVWEVYGNLPGTRLVRMTHQKDGPWAQTWVNDARSGKIKGVDIPEDSIQQYFERAAQEQARDAV